MSDDIPPEAHAMIGAERTRTCEVRERDIRRFAQAIGAPDPGRDERSAEDDRLAAPPLFYQVFVYDDVSPDKLPPDGSPIELDVPIPASRTVGGSSHFEVERRARAGDRLSVTSRLRDVFSKEGRSGRLYFIVVETEFHDEAGNRVAREEATYIKRR